MVILFIFFSSFSFVNLYGRHVICTVCRVTGNKIFILFGLNSNKRNGRNFIKSLDSLRPCMRTKPYIYTLNTKLVVKHDLAKKSASSMIKILFVCLTLISICLLTQIGGLFWQLRGILQLL